MTNMDNKDANLVLVNDAEDMMEEGQLGEGMRKRTSKHPFALSATSKKQLSVTSRMYDVDGDGQLDETEQAMRDQDTDNRGYLTNEKVYKIMLEQMKLQKEVFGLKRMSQVFLAVIFILSLSTLGTSFAAATLAKDTNISNGHLVAKDGGDVVGTSNAAATFIVTESALSPDEDGTGRRLGSFVYQIDRISADEVWRRCEDGQSVLFKRSCSGGSIVEVPICSGGLTSLIETPEDVLNEIGPKYKFTQLLEVTTVDCSVTLCTVGFSSGTPDCPTTNNDSGDTLLDNVPVFNVQDANLNGKTLVPGIYNVATAILLSGVLTLDANGDVDAVWTFNIGGTLNTAASSEMKMINGGRPANVHWIVAGAITLGAHSTVIGDMRASGAFNLGTGIVFTFEDDNVESVWTFNIGGALTTAAGSKMVTNFTNTGSAVIWNVDGAMTLGANSIAKGKMNSLHGAITVGAAASSEDLEAFGALTLGARACSGTIHATGAITLGAFSNSGVIIFQGAAFTMVAGATKDRGPGWCDNRV
jgi:hypothetical protein